MKCLPLLPLPLLLLIPAATPLRAGWVDADRVLENGGFESNMAHWTHAGVATTTQGMGGITSAEGARMARIWPPSASSPIEIRTLENNLVLPAGTLAATVGVDARGSVIWQEIEGYANDVIQLQWNLAALKGGTASVDASDFAFWSLARPYDRDLPRTGQATLLGTMSSVIPDPTDSPLFGQTLFQQATITLPEDGKFILGFGVVDVAPGSDLTPHLLIDNVHFSTAAVPEPTTLVLCGIGGAGLAAGAWRRRSA